MKVNLFFLLAITILMTLLPALNSLSGCKENTISAPVPESAIKLMIYDINLRRSVLANGNQKAKDNKMLPKSKRMNQIYWNSDLAEKAQKWVNELIKECKFEHNPDSYVITPEKKVFAGENLYGFRTSDPKSIEDVGNTFLKANRGFWDYEVRYFDVSNISNYKFDKVYGHFSAMAWGSTSEIGCAYGLHADEKWSSNELVVCYYTLPGNYEDFPVYEEGDVCSACDEGVPCSENYPGLCGNSGLYRRFTTTGKKEIFGEDPFGLNRTISEDAPLVDLSKDFLEISGFWNKVDFYSCLLFVIFVIL